MNVLITGGAGFVGSHVTKKFLDAGYDVIVLDTLTSYTYPFQSWFIENVQYRQENLLKGATVLRGNTMDVVRMYEILQSYKPRILVHMAAMPIANLARQMSEEAFRGIVQGTKNVLETVRLSNCLEKFVYISSSMAYGDFAQDPCPEDAPMNPLSIYGAMKLAGELLVKAYSKTYQFPSIIIRPSAIYGPSDCNMRVVQAFLHNAVEGKTLKVVAGKDTIMDFTYVEDAADGIFLASTRQTKEQIFNITRGEGRSLDDLVEAIRTFYSYTIKVETVPDLFDRPKRGTLDTSRAVKELGYRSVFSLEAGVSSYVNYIRAYNQSLRRI